MGHADTLPNEMKCAHALLCIDGLLNADVLPWSLLCFISASRTPVIGEASYCPAFTSAMKNDPMVCSPDGRLLSNIPHLISSHPIPSHPIASFHPMGMLRCPALPAGPSVPIFYYIPPNEWLFSDARTPQLVAMCHSILATYPDEVSQ